ncbi:hypothetical protein [Mycolicibacterium goodii]|uniref:Lipoprotein n=1 Tax=Mycolicibacterium goodii TaxID=134601 RepID=A0ABS6HK50_MYCGD|nr:hypothetical protein [Mycolicibacterium goodii]OKH76093.1 hypothetical protein EB74_00390 [Mycobacterium sp. SWH-M5]MBU8819412.1 hypothetical protein [Mycolicibacterium goodii]MBU8822588.1 hypothetical protein [Mycolicibacterium goodii]MBU8829575.1 hypothetical protein [Mycolicibacterium goodii]MBU8835139.1 hypothetical protein [Mycolicibacterium goodii]
MGALNSTGLGFTIIGTATAALITACGGNDPTGPTTFTNNVTTESTVFETGTTTSAAGTDVAGFDPPSTTSGAIPTPTSIVNTPFLPPATTSGPIPTTTTLIQTPTTTATMVPTTTAATAPATTSSKAEG